jgi:hypothetical protein
MKCHVNVHDNVTGSLILFISFIHLHILFIYDFVAGARARLNFDNHDQPMPLHTPEIVDSTSGEASEETSEPPSSPSPSPQHLSECSPSPSSEDLHTSVATCIGQSPEKVHYSIDGHSLCK